MKGKVNIEYALTRGVEEILPSKEGLAKVLEKEKITLYQGFDPSMPSLHLGNLVGLIKLSHFQKLGHKVIFLVGDFTGMIGDPTDKSAARQKLTREEVLKNAKKWKEQVAMVLNLEGDNPAEIKFNSEWSDKITFKDLIETTSHFSVQRLLERDMFQNRLENNKPVRLHEFLYPVAQAIDSVEMDVDLEIGGSDQIFNMLAGRTLMKATKDKEKFVLATKLLVDKEGNKVGKTTGNAIFLDQEPGDFYAGMMSFPDETIYDSFELLTDVDLKGLKSKVEQEPMVQKKNLAYEVVKNLWGEEKSKKAETNFESTVQKGNIPNNLPLVKVTESPMALLDLVWETKAIDSRSQIKRLIIEGAIEIDGKKINDPSAQIKTEKAVKMKVGKTKYFEVIKK